MELPSCCRLQYDPDDPLGGGGDGEGANVSGGEGGEGGGGEGGGGEGGGEGAQEWPQQFCCHELRAR